MTPSSIRRLRSAAVALTLTTAATGTAIAVAGPAHAISNICNTTSTLKINGSTADRAIRYGSPITVEAHVDLGTCSFPDGVPVTVEAGTLSIERATSADGPWTTVASVDVGTGVTTVSKAGISGKGFLPGLTLFRAHYAGTTSPEPSIDTFYSSYDFSWAEPVRIQQRTATRRSASYVEETWKITPAASISGLRVQIQRRVDGAWSTVARRLVDSTGRFTFRFTKGTSKVLLPESRGYAGSSFNVVIN